MKIFTRPHTCSRFLSLHRSILPLLILSLGLGFLPRVFATSTLPFYESFPTNYTEGGNLGASANGSSIVWDTGGSAGAGLNPASAAALTYGGLSTSNGSRGLIMSSTGTSRNRGASFTSQTLGAGNPKIYFSFLFNIQTPPSTSTRSLIYLRADASSGTPHFGVWMNSSSQLLIGKNTTSPTATTAALAAGTHLIICRYSWVNGTGNDIGDIWIDPGSLGSTDESSLPGVSLSVTNGNDQATLASIILSCPGNNTGGTAWLDELRVGLTWADVTPTGGPAPTGEKLTFTTQPTNTVTSGTLNPVVVQIQNAGGQNAPSNNVPVTLTLSSGTGTLGGTTTQNTDATGKATFSDLTIDEAGAKQLSAAASGIGAGLAGGTSSSFNITNPVVGAVLVFTTQPSTTLAGQIIAPVIAQVRDGSANNAASNNVPITLTLTSGSGTLSGTVTQNTDATGKATFNDLSIDLSGPKQLTAAASGIGAGLANGTSANFLITDPPIPTRLGFVTVPPAMAGLQEAFTPQPVIVVLDQFDLPISNATDSITVAPSGGTLLGTTSVAANDINGRAAFQDLRMANQGSVTLTFSATGLTSTNATVSVGPGTAMQLLFTTQPGGTITNNGTPFPVQPVIKTADRFGNLSTFNLPASLPVTLTNLSGVGTLSGALTADLGAGALNGVWSPSGIAYTTGGGAQVLAAVADWSSVGKAVLRNRWNFDNNLNDVYGGHLGSQLGGDATYAVNGANTVLKLTGGNRYVDVGSGLISSLSNVTVEVWSIRRQSGTLINNQRYLECGGINPNDPTTLTYFSVSPKLGWGTGGNCNAVNREGQGAGGWATTNAPNTDYEPTNSSSYFSAGNVDVLAENAYLYQVVRLDPQNLAISCTSNLVANCYTRVPVSGWPLSAINDTNCFFGRLIMDSPASHYTMVDLDEIRIWEGQLDDAALTNHSLAGSSQVLIRNGQSVQFNLGGTIPVGQPRITSAFVSGMDLNLIGTGGVASATFWLRSSTEVEQPITNWSYLATNNFDGGGNFNFTTPYTNNEAKRFYRIHIP
ncbi:MAG: hypothetical protein EPO07_19425 [Verrucomicrobia bacterium]|nr:MAG: hypothetical protein EPO07_19425 [Verrucomicrobiota bacterium]